MSSEIERLLTRPDHHFLTFDGDSALFLPMDRESYWKSAFLDGRAQGLSTIPIHRPLDPLIAEVKGIEAAANRMDLPRRPLRIDAAVTADR